MVVEPEPGRCGQFGRSALHGDEAVEHLHPRHQVAGRARRLDDLDDQVRQATLMGPRVVGIGKAGFQIPVSQSLSHVFGYACGLDMTRRDLQIQARAKQLPWDFAKDFENAAVLSEMAPVSEVGHPEKGRIELKVNGNVRQSSDLSMMIHPVSAIIAHLSRFYHLEPGDLIFTGTPEGVGPVIAGDRIEGMIEGVGEVTLSVGIADSP